MIDLTKLRESQMCQLKLLEKFKEICEAEHLTYYLSGGSTLGAVRHKGFIPWDDDIDVVMPRKDYEKFLRVSGGYLEGGQIVRHFTTDKNYPDYTMKLEDTNVAFVVQKANNKVEQNVWIDIFPMDGAPDSERELGSMCRRIYRLRMKLALSTLENVQYNEDRAAWKKFIIFVATHIPFYKAMNPHKIMLKLDRELQRYDPETSKQIGTFMGAYYEKEIMPKEYFGDGKMAEFEGGMYPVPVETDKYLRHMYGDYMQLPPEDKRVPKHSVLEILYRFPGEEK